MADSVSTLAGQLRPFWLRDLGASAPSTTGASGMIAHSLNGGYHSGTLDESQAPWAVTDSEFSTHTGNANAHHARQHSITSTSDHTITASAYQIVGATSLNTLGLLTPSSDVSAGDTAILRSASGTLTVGTLTAGTRLRGPILDTASGALTLSPANGAVGVGSAFTLYTGGDHTAGPDVLFAASGLIAAQDGMYFAIDTTNTLGNASYQWLSGAQTSAGTALMTLAENGYLTVSNRVRVDRVDTAANALTLSPAADLNLSPVSNVVLLDGKRLTGTAGFVSGFAGSGFELLYSSSRANLEVDNLTVRGRMNVYELMINRIRATNGALFVSDVAKATSVVLVSGVNYRIYFDTEITCGLLAGDLIRAQKYTGSTPNPVYQCNMQVTTVSADSFRADLVSGDAPAAGMEFVRLGSATDATRRGSIYLTSSGNYTPYIDIVAGVNSFTAWNSVGKVRVRLGDLDGLSLPGSYTDEFGLFAGNGVAVTSQYVRVGDKAMLINNIPLQMSSGGVQTFNLAADGSSMWIGPSSANKQLDYNAGSLSITGTITAAAGSIANWSIGTVDANTLSSSNTRLVSGSNARLEVGVSPNIAGITSNSAGGAPLIWAGSAYADRATAPFRVTAAGNVTMQGTITATAGSIANWSIGTVDANTLSSNNIRLIAGATAVARLEVGSTGTAGILSRGTGTGTVFWAGCTFADLIASSANAPFRVGLNGSLAATDASITGAITASSGSITGNFYTGTNNNRFSTDGIRLKMPASSSLNINTSPAAFRWFEDLDVSPTAATNYVGMLAYRNTAGGNNVIDSLTTAYVGTSNYTTYSARVGLQAGNSDGANYRSVYLLVIKDPGANDTGSIQCTATQTKIDGMLSILAKTPASFEDGPAYTYFTPNGNFVVAFKSGATTKYRYMSLTGTNANWTYTTTAPS
jgi:hypothetical protein